MTDVLRQEILTDPLALGYEGQTYAQIAEMLNRPRHAEAGTMRSRAEKLGLGYVTESEVMDALAAPPDTLPGGGGPDTTPPDTLPGPEPEPDPDVLAEITVLGTGTARDHVLAEYAHSFVKGALAADSGLALVDDAGFILPTQVDAHACWDDGSVRHASIAVELPAVTGSKVLTLHRAAPTSEAMTDDGVPVTIRVNDWTFTADDDNVVEGCDWRNGLLVREIRYEATVPPENCGSDGLRLVLDVTHTKDGRVAAVVALRNDRCLDAGTMPASYTLTVEIAGIEQCRYEITDQGIYTAFIRRVEASRNGMPFTGPMATVKPDVDMLADRGVTPRLDWQLGIDSRFLDIARSAMGDANWDAPFDPRGVVQYQPMTGGRGDIGVCPDWVAAWLITGEPDLLAWASGKAEALGGCPWHFWDAENEVWLNSQDHPGLWTDARDPNWLPVVTSGDWTPDAAHAPEAASVLYAVTGRRVWLDELEAEAAYCVMVTSPGYQRGMGWDPATGDGCDLQLYQQIRCAAWSMRTVHQAALLAPEDRQGAYWQDVLRGSHLKFQAHFSEWEEIRGEYAGFLGTYEGGGVAEGHLACWQTDHHAAVIAQSVTSGICAEAQESLEWMAHWSVERFLREDFSPGNAVAYALKTSPGSGPYFTKWSEIQAKMETDPEYKGNPPDWTIGSENDYGKLALQTLATMLDAPMACHDRVRQAWDYLRVQPIPNCDATGMRKEPQKSVVPRGFTRA